MGTNNGCWEAPEARFFDVLLCKGIFINNIYCISYYNLYNVFYCILHCIICSVLLMKSLGALLGGSTGEK